MRECAHGHTSISAISQRSASAVISAAESMIDVLALRLLDSTSREVHLPHAAAAQRRLLTQYSAHYEVYMLL